MTTIETRVALLERFQADSQPRLAAVEAKAGVLDIKVAVIATRIGLYATVGATVGGAVAAALVRLLF